jgi:hypothetical protein
MAYTINLTNGNVFAVVQDGTINTQSSMVLVGKNYAGYGEFLDENFIHLLENGANTTAPGAPLRGQLWFDNTANVLKVYDVRCSSELAVPLLAVQHLLVLLLVIFGTILPINN